MGEGVRGVTVEGEGVRGAEGESVGSECQSRGRSPAVAGSEGEKETKKSRVHEDEIESLQAIYGDDFHPTAESAESHAFSITVSSADSRQCVGVQITYPEGYPATCSPVYELRNSEWLSDTDVQYIAKQLAQIYRDSEGEVLVYQWIECIRDRINTHVSVEATADVTAQEDYDTAASGDTSIHMHSHTSVSSSTGEMTESDPSFKSQCRGVQASDSTQLCGGETRCPVIVHGEPLTDRKSTFQAHAAVINRRQEVEVVVAELKKNKKVASATHNIMAYRYCACAISIGTHVTEIMVVPPSVRNPSFFRPGSATDTHPPIITRELMDGSKGVLLQDCDDDGESAAGGRLLHLLQMMNAMNVIVIVSRWYGGIQLHGDRFKHINNVARILLQETRVGLEKESSLAKSARTKGKRTKY